MILVKILRFFGVRSVTDLCARTAELLLSGATAENSCETLIHEGFSEKLAAKAVTLLPSAFARAVYEPKGIKFPDSFYSGAKAYQNKRLTRYDQEPVFKAAVNLAQRLQFSGEENIVMGIVELSTEHDAITKAVAQGLTPSDFSFLIHEF